MCVTRRVPSAMHVVATVDFLDWRAAMRAHSEILRFPLFIFLHPQQEVSTEMMYDTYPQLCVAPHRCLQLIFMSC